MNSLICSIISDCLNRLDITFYLSKTIPNSFCLGDMEIFKDFTQAAFEQEFPNEDACLEYLSNLKWGDGFVCRNCGHTHYCQGKSPFSRRCTKCKHLESATAHTLFHKCKLPLNEAFGMMHFICRKPGISSYELAKIFNRRQMTCWNLKKKVKHCLESGGSLLNVSKE